MCSEEDDTVVGSELCQCGVGEVKGIHVANGISKKIGWVGSGTHR